MDKQIFTNDVIISWLQYYSQNTTVDLEHVKMIDITKKNKNVIPTVEAHKTTMVFTNAGVDDIFYRLWDAGLGECEVWYNEGSNPEGPILHNYVKEMINRGINASAAMLVINPQARNTAKIGLANELFQRGSIHYVGSEIRAIILSKMNVAPTDDICVISGESIAIEAALIAVEGSVTAVEYKLARPRNAPSPRRPQRPAQCQYHRARGRTQYVRLPGALTCISGGIRQHGSGACVPHKAQPEYQCRDLYT